MNYDWNFGRLIPYYHAFVAGTITTIELTLLIILCGTCLGILVGLLLRNPIWRLFLFPFIDALRAIPPMVLLLFMYYLLTVQVIGTMVAGFWVCVIAFSLNLSAFTSDLVRATIETVEKDTIDAARALGMSNNQITRHIVLPHVLRELIPGMTVLYIGMLKMTSLASVINVGEVVFTAQTVIADISRSLEAWAIVALIYMLLVIPATYGARRLERWAHRGGSSGTAP